jgi:Flp pilus assembly protein TadD
VRGSEDALPDPKDMIAVMHKVDFADQLNRAGRSAEALTLIEECLKESPHDRKVLHVKAKILLRFGREEEAEQALVTASSFHANVDTSILLAQIRIKQGRFAEAIQDLALAEEMDPYHGGVHIARGDLLAQENRIQDAFASYQRAIELDPHRLGLAAKQRIAALNKRFNTP